MNRVYLHRILRTLMPRRSLVRAGRVLMRAGRLDLPNCMEQNGELEVLRVALDVRGQSPERAVVLDCGANVGAYVRAALRCAEQLLVPPPSIHAFEPATATFARLRANTFPTSVTLVRLALAAAASDEASLHVVHDTAGVNSLIASDLKPIAATELVPVSTVDSYCATHGIQEVRLLKIDTEGNDFNVLLGARSMLSSGSLELVQFEYNHRWIFARAFLRDVFELVRGMPYQIGKVTPEGIEFYPTWHPELETFCEGNYLLCLASWRGRFREVEWWNSRDRR